MLLSFLRLFGKVREGKGRGGKGREGKGREGKGLELLFIHLFYLFILFTYFIIIIIIGLNDKQLGVRLDQTQNKPQTIKSTQT